ncbi:MAG: flagellar protein [Bradyrhizobium sp.]
MTVINSVGNTNILLGQSIVGLKNQLDTLQIQLATGRKSTVYSGMGLNEGFAIFARSQLSNLSAFSATMTNINTIIDTTDTALTSFSKIATQVKSATANGGAIVTGSGQTVGQQTALLQLKSMLEILNTQAGDRFLFSGSAIDTPSVASVDEILNGKGALAGLKQLIAERNQADLGASGLGRLVISSPSPTSVAVAEDVAGSPFGFKLNAITSSLTGATVTGPSGSPAAVSVDLGPTNPNNGEQVTFTFNLPDGTTEAIQLTASNATPPPSGSFAIGANSTVTAANLKAALNTALGTLANTALVAASAMAASDNFFNRDSIAVGSVVNNKAAVPAPITGATLLSGAANTDSLATNFAVGDTITVNGKTLTFVAAGAQANQLNVTDNVQTLLTKIDAITGTSTPSSVSGGVITLHTDDAASLNVTSSNAAAFAALGFGPTATAVQPPLRVGGVPLGTATTLVSGAANTVAWYTGEAGSGPARASSTARVDQTSTIQFGVRANEQAIRTALQAVAAFAAVTISPTSANATTVATALNQRVAGTLTPTGRQQSLADIETDLASAQVAMKDISARQGQSQVMLQSLVDQSETVSSDQVATELLALQTRLQASYQTTSMLSQLSLLKFLPIG